MIIAISIFNNRNPHLKWRCIFYYFVITKWTFRSFLVIVNFGFLFRLFTIECPNAFMNEMKMNSFEKFAKIAFSIPLIWCSFFSFDVHLTSSPNKWCVGVSALAFSLYLTKSREILKILFIWGWGWRKAMTME